MKRLKKSFRKFFEKIFEKYFLDLSMPTLPQQIKHLPLYRHKGNEPALSYKNNQDNACYDKQKNMRQMFAAVPISILERDMNE